MDGKWLIYSVEHKAWWKADGKGYTTAKHSAGQFTFAEACEIVKGANVGCEKHPCETMVRVG